MQRPVSLDFRSYTCVVLEDIIAKNPVKTDNKSDNHGKKEKKEKKNSYRATLFHRVGVAVNVAELVAWRKEEKEEEGREALW